jgi:hypothetical protein
MIQNERNRILKESMQKKYVDRIKKSLRESYGIDLDAKGRNGNPIFNFNDPLFSFKRMRENAVNASFRLKERNTASTLGALTRAGVLNIANDKYLLHPTLYDKIMEFTTSNKLAEFYSPLHRATNIRRVAPGDKFPEVSVEGLDVMIENGKFGAMFSVTREMIDDDQTSQIQKKAGELGENAALYLDYYALTRFLGKSGVVYGDAVSMSKTYPGGVFKTALTGGGRNRPDTFVRFSESALESAFQMALAQKDLQGNPIAITADALIVSKTDIHAARVMTESDLWPSAQGSKAAGVPGGMASKNPYKGIYEVDFSVFVPDYAWQVGKKGAGIVFQQRDPLEVTQEAPNSGDAFEVDAYRHRVRTRFECDWIDPRFWIQMNDGTVTS